MSGIEPSKIDTQGLKLVSEDETQSITFKMDGTKKGIVLEYDLGGTPKQFDITPNGVEWTNGVDTYNTALSRLALVQQAFEAVELPPNADTLAINNTLLIDDGSGNTASLSVLTGNLDIVTSGITTFNNLPECSVVPTTGDQLVNKTYVDSKVGNLYFYDECWRETNGSGLLCFERDGTGTGSATMVNAEAGHYGIVKIATPSSNTNTTWTMTAPLLWANVDYCEVVFRGWATGSSTNTTLSVGLLNSKTGLNTTAVTLMYSNNIAPTGVWNILANSVSVGSFTGTLATQNVGVWLKIRITNTNDSGSFSATLTRLDTNDSETITGSGVATGTQFYLGGGVSCISGATSKNVDFDSFELQLK